MAAAAARVSVSHAVLGVVCLFLFRKKGGLKSGPNTPLG